MEPQWGSWVRGPAKRESWRVAAAAVAILVAACSAAGPLASASCGGARPPLTAPAGGLTRSQAVAAALAVAPRSASTPNVVWTQVSSSPFSGDEPSGGKLVWMVRLEADFDVPACLRTDVGPEDVTARRQTPSDPPCLDDAGGIVAVLEMYTGRLIGWTD